MKNLNSKKMMALAAALFALNISATAFAAEISATDAKNVAVKVVPASAEYVATENDLEDKDFDVKFYDSKARTAYEVEVSKLTGEVREYKMELKGYEGSPNAILSVEDVKQIVLKEYPDAAFKAVKLDVDKETGLKEYDVKFSTKAVIGDYDINPENGQVVEKDIKYIGK